MIQPGALASTLEATLDRACQHAPYLKRLITTSENVSANHIQNGDAQKWFETALSAMQAGPESMSVEAVMQWLRLAKRDVHLAIAAGDLSGQFSQARVTQAITAFADAAVEIALRAALNARGLSGEGLFIIALGKMGAGELNYSSDIDIVAMYDPDTFDGGERSKSDAAMRVIQDMTRILEERTSDGYVFRVDLRLRPDPSSTPACVSTQMAETYYESVGQNWERMAWIKARACAGDFAAAEKFIQSIQPFVWRRHLDYWAIGDIHAIKRMVNAKVGDLSLYDPSADVKLGPGGIREIEFFAQTQQLILGGRNPRLRATGTIDALDVLASEGVISPDTARHLTQSYHSLRAVEHRIQMLNDQQTHTLPKDEALRADVAALLNIRDLEQFDSELLKVRQSVHSAYSELFADEERRTAEATTGNLVFTGVDDDPGTIDTLSHMGFSNPSRVIATIRKWHHGKTPATRTSRGRGLLTALLPQILTKMSDTGEADTAFERFVTFFEQLSSGVQTLAMLLAEPILLEDLVSTLGIAPRLATTLGWRPELLEALIEGSAVAALDISQEASFEDAMDAARRYHRDQSFLVGHRLLHGRLNASDAGLALSDLADELIAAMASAAEKETARRFGASPGHYTVAALGKLGGRELSATSDLDLIVIYDAPTADAPQTWFTKFTQRLITALSAPTGQGTLYEVDMRLRPSGNSGPVATSLTSFKKYHSEQAWTWERMALTRLRPVTGDADLQNRVRDVARDALSVRRAEEQIRADILNMRQRLAKEKPETELWQLKSAPGGLVDVEFVVQQALLLRRSDALQPSTSAAIQSLAASGDIPTEDATSLSESIRILQCLQQVIRVSVTGSLDPERASAGLKSRLARAIGAASFSEASDVLRQAKQDAAKIRCKYIGELATD